MLKKKEGGREGIDSEEGWREGGGRKEGRKGGREGGKERERGMMEEGGEGGRDRGKEGGRERGREGARERVVREEGREKREKRRKGRREIKGLWKKKRNRSREELTDLLRPSLVLPAGGLEVNDNDIGEQLA